MRIYFYDELGFFAWCSSFLRKRVVYYNTLSTSMKLIVSLFTINLSENAKTIWFGGVNKATGVRKSAYQFSLKKISEMELHSWCPRLKLEGGVDHEIIAKKLLLDSIYNQKEFINFSKQFSLEHPDDDVVVVTSLVDGAADLFGADNFTLMQPVSFSRLKFLAGVLALPFFLVFFIRKNKGNDAFFFENAVVCEVDCLKIYEMFETLFSGMPLAFFIKGHYVDDFGKAKMQELNVVQYSLSQNDQGILKLLMLLFVKNALKNFKLLSSYGFFYFNLFKCIANGLLFTPNCKNSIYFTSEHMSTVHAVRNEYLRLFNNTSVFIPYNAYAIDHYYSPEYCYNYDVLCSPSKLLEDVYDMQDALTNIRLSTGSYSPHRLSLNEEGLADRLSKLKTFKNGYIAITFLSSGIQDETLSGEERLALLANKVSSIDGVRVFYRPKPVRPPKKYESFFADRFHDNPSVLLTDSSFDLFDFLHVTDLFVTGFSSSAVDLCIAGGSFYSVDFWGDKDMYLWQTSVEGVYLEEEDAFETILQWIEDTQGEREIHGKRMDRLRKYVAYRFDTFEAYKENLLSLVGPYLPENEAALDSPALSQKDS